MKQSILILGDSNTKHIKLSGAYNIVRDPTFLIQDINPDGVRVLGGYGYTAGLIT